jgi:hypothetical protein
MRLVAITDDDNVASSVIHGHNSIQIHLLSMTITSLPVSFTAVTQDKFTNGNAVSYREIVKHSCKEISNGNLRLRHHLPMEISLTDKNSL